MSSEKVGWPWRESATGSVWSNWNDVPDDIRSSLEPRDRCQTVIGEFHYFVMVYNNGNIVVYRNRKGEYNKTQTQTQKQFSSSSSSKHQDDDVIEIQVLPLEEANKLLAIGAEYEIVGYDPVKVLNGQFFVVIGRKSLGTA